MQINSQIASILFHIPAEKFKSEQHTLNNAQVQEVENALALVPLLKLIEIVKQQQSERQFTPIAKMDQMKKLNTASAKLYNWNIVIEVLGILGIKHQIEGDIKQHVLMGDYDVIVEIINQIYSDYQSLFTNKRNQMRSNTSEIKLPNSRGSRAGSKTHQKLRNISTHVESLPSLNDTIGLSVNQSYHEEVKKKQNNKQVDLMNVAKEPSQALSALELFISSLQKHLQISSKQAATLFADNNKYLAHVLAKGVQGVFEPVLNYLKEIFNLTNNLVKLLDEKSLVFCLQVLKPGFVSKSREVSLLSCKLMLKLHQELQQLRSLSIIEDCYKWLIEKGGFQTIQLGINRHPDNNIFFTSLLIEFSKMHMQEMFTIIIRSHIQHEGDRIAFLDAIIVPLGENKLIHSDLLSLGIINDWFEMCFKFRNLNNDYRISAARLLSSIWKYFINYLDDNDERGSRILRYFTELIQLKSLSVSIFTANLMFQLLQLFTQLKHKAAPVFYKTLISIFIETYQSQDIKIFFLNNFENTIQTCPNIPISLLIEPLVKKLQSESPCASIIKFFGTLSEHKGLTIISMIQILDTMAKLSLYDIPHYNGAAELICKILGRGLFIEEAQPTMIEFALKYVKVALNVYFRSVKQKKDTNQSPQKGIQQLSAQQKIDAQKRSQIIKILIEIVLFQNEDLNQKIKLLVFQIEQQCRDILRLPNKGTMAILALFGKPEEVFNQIKKEMNISDTDQNGHSVRSKRSKSLGPSTKKPDMNKLTKEEQYYLASLRMPKNVNPKVVAELKEVKETYQNKIQQQEDDQKMNEAAIQRQKQFLRKQLEKRSIEYGVATKNMNDVEVKLLYQDGSREKETKSEKKTGLPIMEIVDLSEEEDRDRLMVDIILQQSGRVLRWVFQKYANSGFKVKQAQSFDQLKQHNNSINVADIRKFLQDYELDTCISMDEITSLAREVHIKLLEQRNDLNTFEFNSFQIFFIQLCINLSPRAPFKSKNIPPHKAIQQIFKYMREITASRKQSTQLYDDPDAQYFSQSDIIKEYNKKLNLDPNFQLPEGFKKVTQPNLTFSYIFCKQLHIKKSKLIAYQILDELVGKLFDVHLIEPITTKSTIQKAQPNTLGYIYSKLNQNGLRPSIDQLTLDKEKTMKQSSPIKQKRRVLEIEPKRELSLNVKLELNKFSIKDRLIAEQVANVLDDIIHAVEFDKTNIDRDVNNFQNKAIELKKLQDLQKQQIQKEREDKRKKRQQEVKQSLLELRKEQQQKAQNEQKVKIEQDLLIEKDSQNKERKRKEYLDILKVKVQENKIQINKEVSQKEQEIRQKKMEELQKKKKEFMQFNKEKLKEFQQELRNENILNKFDQKIQQQKETEKVKRMEKLREQYKEMDVRRIQFEKETSFKINQQFNSPAYKEIFKKNEVQLQGLFDFLIKETFYPIGKPASRDHITLRTFTWFTDKFKITPEILTLQDVVTIFRSLTRDKPVVDRIPIGMDINEFFQALHRLSIKGKNIFNTIASKIKIKGNATVKEMDQIVEDGRQQNQLKSQAQFENVQLNGEDLSFDNQQRPENEKQEMRVHLNEQNKGLGDSSVSINNKKEDFIEAQPNKVDKKDKLEVNALNKEENKTQQEEYGKKTVERQGNQQQRMINDEKQNQGSENKHDQIKGTKITANSQNYSKQLNNSDQINNAISEQNVLKQQLSDGLKRRVVPRSVVKMYGDRKYKKKEDQKIQYLIQILSNLMHKNQSYFFYGFESRKNKQQKQNQELQLIDNYGNVDESTQDTLLALIVYLNLSADKNQMEMRFRQILEEGKVPTKLRKQGLKQIMDTAQISN